MNNSEDIRDWDARLTEQAKRGWDNYLRRRINLDVARDDDIWNICGEFIYVEEVSSALAVGSIKLNRDRNDPIDLELGTVIKTMFTQVFITHAALQDEWIDIVYGINFEYYKAPEIIVGAIPLPVGASTAALQLADGHNVTVDNAGGAAAVNIQDGGNAITVDGAVVAEENGGAQPAIIITNGVADNNTVGANHACNRVLIRAFTTNTGLVWVDFNNAAVENACYPLDTGDAISVPLTNTNLINCLFKVANEDVAVIYTA